MKQNNYITHYHFTHFRYQHLYSAGPDVFFDKPCIGYIKKGYVKFFHKGKTIYAYSGDLIYIAFETRYQSIWFGNPDIEWYSINFEFSSKYAFYSYRFQILKNYPEELFEKMYQTYQISSMRSISYFYQLLDDIYIKLSRSDVDSSHALIEPAIAYIESNYNKQIHVKFLADLCHISESAFFQLFKKSTGVTPIIYKHNIMIQNAIDLLSNTDISIEEISNRVGFSSSNYFRKIFIKLTSKTPKELRKK